MSNFFWDLIKDAPIPLKGHFNSKVDEVVTLNDLYTNDHSLGKKIFQKTKFYDKVQSEINPSFQNNFDKIDTYRFLTTCFSSENSGGECPYCGQSAVYKPLLHYTNTKNFTPEELEICPMAHKKTMQQTLHVPSGKIVIANDLRGLIIPYDMNDSGKDNEINRQNIAKGFEKYGLIYIYTQNFSYSLCETNEEGTLCLTNRIYRPESYEEGENPFEKTYPEGLKITKSLSATSCSLLAVCLMDFDHYNKAMALVGVNDETIYDRFKPSIIEVTPGVYTTHPFETKELRCIKAKDEDHQNGILFRRVKGAVAQVIEPVLPTMHDAFQKLCRSDNPYDDTPLLIQRERVDWALGCIAQHQTGGMGNQYKVYQEVEHHFPHIKNMLKVSARIRATEGNIIAEIKKSYKYQDTQSVDEIIAENFTKLPQKISSFAIAGLICGTDTAIESLSNNQNGENSHEILEFIDIHLHYRNRLWGAAYEHRCVEQVERYLTELQSLIDNHLNKQ